MSAILIPVLIIIITLSAALLGVLLILFLRRSPGQIQLDEEALLQLDPEQQELFYQAKEYLDGSDYMKGPLTLSQNCPYKNVELALMNLSKIRC